MESQDNYYPSEQGSSKRKMANRGGERMNRGYSDQSASTRYSDSTSGSSSTNMSYNNSPLFVDYETYPSGYHDADYNAGSFGSASLLTSDSYEAHQHLRCTPSSLGWLPDTELIKLYTFVVGKSKDPYLELLPTWTVTYETPRIVYLDQPEYPQTGKTGEKRFSCQFPSGCRAVFKRPADLDRHYKHVHAPDEQRDRLFCDYERCGRSTEPFGRKDHCRDHYRDYHKEDLGCAKREKKLQRKEWLKAQQIWLEERVIDPRWWRCARCLSRMYVDKDSWECRDCKTQCEAERMESRQRLQKNPLTDGHNYGDPSSSYNTINSGCTTCGATGWVMSEYSESGWDPCCNCQAMQYTNVGSS